MSFGKSSRRFQDQSASVEAEQDGSLTLRQQLQNLARARRDADKSKRFFVLYLSRETWLGAAGSKLADQVPRRSDVLHVWKAQLSSRICISRYIPLYPAPPPAAPPAPLHTSHTEQVRAARAAGIRVVLVHERDPTRGGCEFGSFFLTTPQDLISDGLYARVAIALHSGQHRTVSLCLFALEVGAVRYHMKEALWSRGKAGMDAAKRKVAELREPPAPTKLVKLKSATLALRLSPSRDRGLTSSVDQPPGSSSCQPSCTHTTGPLGSSSSVGMLARADDGGNPSPQLVTRSEITPEEVDMAHVRRLTSEPPLQVAMEVMQEYEKPPLQVAMEVMI